MPDESRLRRLREASEWLLRMQDRERTDSDVDGWLQWCAADPENFVEFEKVYGDWHDLDFLKVGARARKEARRTRLLRFTKPRVIAASSVLAVAACASVIAFGVLWGRHRQGTGNAPQRIFATDMNRAAMLPDGSRLILHPDSTVDIDYNRRRRTLVLVAGEAYFKVKHERSHPFVVRAGNVRVTDIGTAFDVRREKQVTTVTVEEGVVNVTMDGASQEGLPGALRLQAGYQLSYSDQRRGEVVSRVDVASALRWRDDELAYVREPLGSVVDDLNRYSVHKIVIDDAAVGRLPFTGTAFPDSLGDWLKAIQHAYPVHARRTPNGDIVLTMRKAQSDTPAVP